tara:strand:- start:423 stop:1172 length:750 start_codon:yes stop_codon:yes gene_type:complete
MDKRPLWTDEELSASLDVYLFMLRLEAADIPFVKSRQEKGALIGPLTERNLISIRFRLRNIAFVMQELGYQPLKAYTPASQVGTHVRARLEKLIAPRIKELEEIQSARNKKLKQRVAMRDVQQRLDDLQSDLRRLNNDEEIIGIGHNNPPGAINLSHRDIKDTIESLDQVRKSLTGPKITESKFRKITAPLLVLGQKLSQLIGSEITNFSKEAIKEAGKSFGRSAGRILILQTREKIIDAISSAFKFLF